MRTLPRRCFAIRMIILLMLQMVSGAFPLLAWSSDFDIPLKELKKPGTDFEIPLSDLKKGEKKTQRKSERRERRVKRKTVSTEQVSPQEASGKPADSNIKPLTPINEPKAEFAPNTQQLQRPATSDVGRPKTAVNAGKTATAPDEIRIVHDPYSYVVTGKRTVMYAVIISSPGALQTVRCRFRSAEGGEFAFVPMEKISGTLYSYTATLPALSESTRALRYSIVAIDTANKETSSREFITPVRATSVVPGWQVEPSHDKIKVRLEKPGKPLEGFFDATVEESGKP